MTARDHISEFSRQVRQDRRANPGMSGDGTGLELLMAPRFHRMLENILAETMPAAPSLLPEYKRAGVGRPDLAFARPAQPARSFIELKVPSKSLNASALRGHDRDQFRRFGALPLWGFCNFHTMDLYRRDEREGHAVLLPAIALEPGTSDAAAERLVTRHDPAQFLQLINLLAAAPPPRMRNAREIAEALGHAAKLARQVVLDFPQDTLPHALLQVRQEFEQTLFSRPAAAGHETANGHALFAGAFAQTLVFGLLLAREAAGGDVDRNAYQKLPSDSLLWATLRALTQYEILDLLGAGFDVLLDTVNAVAPEHLVKRGGYDPILYFYEEFLTIFDPVAREKYGVFYTPVDLVNFIVARTDHALRVGMRKDGLRDEGVLLLDPACGTGTFSVGALNAVATRTEQEFGEGAVPAAVTSLAKRLNAFELLVGPYTVAHWRVAREVISRKGSIGKRLPIWLCDTLAPSANTPSAAAVLGFMAQPMVAERRGADAVKAQAPVLAILGNPPYRRLKNREVNELVGPWMNALWQDLKEPVRAAGAGLSLNGFQDLYIAFWRWALWRLFDAEGAPRRGVVSFVVNRGFMAGRAFGGLRLMLRERFDDIEILDLRGDHRGALPAGRPKDENVFAIQTGVCVITAWARGDKPPGRPARVRYADIWDAGGFRRSEKLEVLRGAAAGSNSLVWRELPQDGMQNLKPLGFSELDWPGVDEVFRLRSNGIVTYRDDFVYATTAATLQQRIEEFLTMDPFEAQTAFGNSATNTSADAQQIVFSSSAIERVSYRPMDRRWLYNRQGYIDRPRTALQEAWGSTNHALFVLEDGTGAGPAAWCHGIKPDQHSFRGSTGGWVFPLINHTEGGSGHYLSPSLIAGLGLAYGIPPSAQQVFDAILALLSAPSYSRDFARDLEDAFPHIPFPANPDVFAAAAALGADIRALQGFTRPPGKAFRQARLLGRATGVTLQVPPPSRAFLQDGAGGGLIPLQEDQSLRLAHVPLAAWEFQVSGYPVLYRWLKAREGDALDAAFTQDVLDLVWRLTEMVEVMGRADAVLASARSHPLTRGELNLPQPVPYGANAIHLDPDEHIESTS